MKMLGSITIIIVILFLIPLHLENQFAELKIETMDGLLGFYSGVLGAYFAFVSAYYIYNKQRHDNVRPILVIELANEPCGEMLHVINRNDDLNSIPLENTRQVAIRIRNIGLGAALDIECEKNSLYKFYYSLPDGYGNETQESLIISGIANNKAEVRDLLVKLPSTQGASSQPVNFTLTYRGVYGQRYSVTAQILIESTNRMQSLFFLRTINHK